MRKGVSPLSLFYVAVRVFLLDVRRLSRCTDVAVSNSRHNLVWYIVQWHDAPENILLCATAGHAINDACLLVLPQCEATCFEDGTHSNSPVCSHPCQDYSHGQTVIRVRH